MAKPIRRWYGSNPGSPHLTSAAPSGGGRLLHFPATDGLSCKPSQCTSKNETKVPLVRRHQPGHVCLSHPTVNNLLFPTKTSRRWPESLSFILPPSVDCQSDPCTLSLCRIVSRFRRFDSQAKCNVGRWGRVDSLSKVSNPYQLSI